jgi:hypothetical protein
MPNGMYGGVKGRRKSALFDWEGENEMATYYSEKQIEKARAMDLLTYLQTYEPTELVHLRGNT